LILYEKIIKQRRAVYHEILSIKSDPKFDNFVTSIEKK
jgi:hypothetical protein